MGSQSAATLSSSSSDIPLYSYYDSSAPARSSSLSHQPTSPPSPASGRSPTPFGSESTQPQSSASNSGWESMSSPSSPGSHFTSSPMHGGMEEHFMIGGTVHVKKVAKRARKVKTVDEKVERKLKKQNHVCKWDNCQEEFPDSAQLRDHLEGHIGRGLSVYNCKWEGCSFGERKKRDHMKSHIRKHHQFVGFYCSHCGEGFVRDQELRKHLCTAADGNQADEDQESHSGSSMIQPNQPFRTAGDSSVVVPVSQYYRVVPPGQVFVDRPQPGGLHTVPNLPPQYQQCPAQQLHHQQQYHQQRHQQQPSYYGQPAASTLAPSANVVVRAPVHFLSPNGPPQSNYPSGSMGSRAGAPHGSAQVPPSPANGQAARGAGTPPGRADQQPVGLANAGSFYSPEYTVSERSSSEYSSPYAVPGSPYSASSPEGYPVAQHHTSQKRLRSTEEDLDAWFSSITTATPSALTQTGYPTNQPFSSEFVQGLNTLISKFEDEPASFDKYTSTIAQCYPYFKKVKQCIEEAHMEPTQEVDDLFDFSGGMYPFPAGSQELGSYGTDLMNNHHVWDQTGAVVVEEKAVTMDRLVSTVPQTFSPQVVRFGGQHQDDDSDEDEEEDEEGEGEDQATIAEYSDDYVTESEDEDELTNEIGQMSLKPRKRRTVKDFLEILDTLLLVGESSQPSV